MSSENQPLSSASVSIVGGQSDSLASKAKPRVGKVKLYVDVENELSLLRPDLNLLDFIRRENIPLYVRLDTQLYIAYIYYEDGGFPRATFKNGVSHFRLSTNTIEDLQRTDGSTTCIEFVCGGLLEVKASDTTSADFEVLDFERGYVVELTDKHRSDRRGFTPEPVWSELASSYLAHPGNIYILERDMEFIRSGFIPDMLEFPPSLEGVTSPIRMMYRAAYEFWAKNLGEEDVRNRLCRSDPTVFAVKRLNEAMGVITGGLREGKNAIAEADISLGGLEKPASDAKSFFDQGFLTSELKSVMLISAWWNNYAGAADDDLLLVLKDRLRLMGFKKSRVPHLMKLIIGDTQWKGQGIDEMLRSVKLGASMEKYP
ncbi:hypothetical protein [Xanthomonas sp. A1809]|uniref:hypothetical protein n=1 Tax=Xanthomonas sp. A1809 TaxID=2821275 RepID=UPI001ADC9D20|nr:hypothetical protein [Xanthomonas sp. A1809]MBO9855144.1 hypothetical protein [Xanthomonas sp. A1809]